MEADLLSFMKIGFLKSHFNLHHKLKKNRNTLKYGNVQQLQF